MPHFPGRAYQQYRKHRFDAESRLDGGISGADALARRGKHAGIVIDENDGAGIDAVSTGLASHTLGEGSVEKPIGVCNRGA